MEIVLGVMILILIGFVTAKLAESRGRNPVYWFVFGILGGIFAIAILFILPPLKKAQEVKEENVAALDLKPKEFELEKNPLTEKLWYYLDQDHKQVGPMEYLDLCTAWEDGTVTEDSYVWCEDMEKWERIKEFKALNDQFNKSKSV